MTYLGEEEEEIEVPEKEPYRIAPPLEPPTQPLKEPAHVPQEAPFAIPQR